MQRARYEMCPSTMADVQNAGPVVGESVSTADAALRSIIRIIFETSTCPALYRLTMNEALQTRMPNYTTRFGFGLHAGNNQPSSS